MDTLQKMITDAILTTFTVDFILAAYIARQLKNRGIILDDRQFESLKAETSLIDEKATNGTENSIHHILQKIGIEAGVAEDIEAHLNALHEDTLTLFAKDLLTKATKIGFETTLKTTFGLAIKDLTKEMEPILEIQKEEREKFNNGLTLIWGDALKKLDFFVTTVTEASRRFHSAHGSLSHQENGITLNALVRLLARACQIAFEILALLKAGFADGANARWRTLHEVAVTAIFISNHGEETAERYLHHYVVDSYLGALTHQEYYERLGYTPITLQELEDLKNDYDQAIMKFGESFKGQYGWAAKALNSKKPTYKDIEANVKLDHLKPHYKYATSSVHATPTGIYAKLSLPESGFKSDLLTGHSMLGLEIPGQSAVHSLYQIAVACLTLDNNADAIHTCNVLEHFKKEAMVAFVEAAQKITMEEIGFK